MAWNVIYIFGNKETNYCTSQFKLSYARIFYAFSSYTLAPVLKIPEVVVIGFQILIWLLTHKNSGIPTHTDKNHYDTLETIISIVFLGLLG